MKELNKTNTKKIPCNKFLDGLLEFSYSPEISFRENVPELPSDDNFSATMPVPGYWDEHLESLRHTRMWQKACRNPDFQEIEFLIFR